MFLNNRVKLEETRDANLLQRLKNGSMFHSINLTQMQCF
jgi:hypothetical protein